MSRSTEKRGKKKDGNDRKKVAKEFSNNYQFPRSEKKSDKSFNLEKTIQSSQ